MSGEQASEAPTPRRAILSLVSGRGLVVVINFATITYLLRVLGPVPFGLLALAAGVLAFINSLNDAGVGASLISDPELSPNRVAAAICVTVAIGGAIGLAGVLATPLMVWFAGTEAIATPWLVLSVLVIPGVVGKVPAALAQRDERFALLAWIQVVACVVASAASIGLAQVRLDVWPLLVRQGLATLLILILLWFRVRPSLARPKRADFTEISRFSLGLLGSQLLHVFHRQSDDVLIGRTLGEQQLGYYNLCYRVLTLPISHISGIATTIAHPRLAALAPDWKAVAEGLARAVGIVAVLTTPIGLGVAVAAPELIEVLFGSAWLPAAIPFRVLALVAVWQAPFHLLGLGYLVRRDTKALTRWGMIATPVYVLSFVVGLPWGIAGVAVAYACANLLLAPFELRMASKVLEQPTRILARGALGGIAVGGLIGAPVVAAHQLAVHTLAFGSVGVLATTVAVGIVVELGAVLWLRARTRSVS